MEDKKKLRKEIMEKLSMINKPLYEQLSYKIANHLYQDKYWQEAETVGITISKQPEVDTYQIIRRAWEEGKRIVIPKCLPKTREMVFRTLCRFDQLESVYYGLLEPIESETNEVSPDDIDLIIVPGLAFTEKGYRLGFGGGYYDRFLTKYNGYTLSLAFQDQIMEKLPVEGHDIPVSKIITDEKIKCVNE
ncbi:5-formyltetrahydrofolate cyclo-ligase [Bacillus sp. DTU_2020_1000418_1_SI_GHA_SEK_038]|uniref:5-formyltetrahydrofolate cyclo-ligase n=1 Tax=Bacillus sp. DTU_2020_1000418_1_SI_GHA_SEK_038 TaxID=3077585 RepID=UPI0028E83985|nr:5-formyltetrahydrofolate cyclo-ligase [Bacillus sp. DTU_2020_1000418_1_SI_GHA_SEK_038]WNS74297.1 5-formyltetrahydrofolate cyclo-ligase [Bacillus sp. DTU_2020_1000418_1_SI_GHA_SEK_038]